MNVLVLEEIIKVTERNWRFIFQDPLYDQLNFIPGQLIQLVSKPGEEGSVIRNYSVASWPDGTNRLELIITYLEGGAMSEYLFREAKVGDEFVYRGPMGIFTLPDKLTEREIYMVSTGSGVSPFRSMINYIAEYNIPFKKIKLFFGTRTQKDLLYRDEFEALEKLLPNFEYVPCLSQESDLFWDGHNGYVHSAYLPELASTADKPLVYFCGWDRMISEGRKHLDELGYKMKDDIRVEIFG